MHIFMCITVFLGFKKAEWNAAPIYFILALTYKIARREIIKIKNTILPTTIQKTTVANFTHSTTTY